MNIKTMKVIKYCSAALAIMTGGLALYWRASLPAFMLGVGCSFGVLMAISSAQAIKAAAQREKAMQAINGARDALVELTKKFTENRTHVTVTDEALRMMEQIAREKAENEDPEE